MELAASSSSRASRLRRRAAGPDAGFSLVEALIAIAILAMAVGFGWQMLAGGLGAASRRAGEDHAMAVAMTRLAAVGIETPLAAGQTSGIDEGVAWRVVLAPMAGPGPAAGFLRVVPWRVRVEVAWRQRGVERSRTLTTVRLGVRPP